MNLEEITGAAFRTVQEATLSDDSDGAAALVGEAAEAAAHDHREL